MQFLAKKSIGTHDLSTFITHQSRVIPVMAEHQGINHHKFRSANGLSSPFLPRTNPQVKDMKYKLTSKEKCIAIICIVDTYSYYAQYVYTCMQCILIMYQESRFTREPFSYILGSTDKFVRAVLSVNSLPSISRHICPVNRILCLFSQAKNLSSLK